MNAPLPRRSDAKRHASAIDRLSQIFFPGVPTHWDDILLRENVLRVLRPEHSLLDLGAGAGIVPMMDFRGKAARICGVDPDPRVAENPHLDEGREGMGEAIPYPDASFDVVVADNVLEHLEQPAQVFAEIERVLRPGGRFLAKTPNKWHYMPLASQLIPFQFHHRVLRRIDSRASEDMFPTRYRANSPGEISRLAREAGLGVVKVEVLDTRRGYLAFNGATYLLGCLYSWIIRSVPGLDRFGVFLIAELEKPLPAG